MSRRVFISNKLKNFQLFSFTQKKDGSIYCNWPDFGNTSWVTVGINKEGHPELKKLVPLNLENYQFMVKACVLSDHTTVRIDPL